MAPVRVRPAARAASGRRSPSSQAAWCGAPQAICTTWTPRRASSRPSSRMPGAPPPRPPPPRPLPRRGPPPPPLPPPPARAGEQRLPLLFGEALLAAALRGLLGLVAPPPRPHRHLRRPRYRLHQLLALVQP